MPYTVVMKQTKKRTTKGIPVSKRHLFKRFEVLTSTDGCVGEIYVPLSLAAYNTLHHLDCEITLHAGAS